MKRINSLVVVFDRDKGKGTVNILVDDRLVHTLDNGFLLL